MINVQFLFADDKAPVKPWALTSGDWLIEGHGKALC